MSDPTMKRDEEIVRMVRGFVAPLRRQAPPADLQERLKDVIRPPVSYTHLDVYKRQPSPC